MQRASDHFWFPGECRLPFSNTILHEKEKQKSKCGIYNVSFVQKQLSILNNNSLNIYDGDFCDIS